MPYPGHVEIPAEFYYFTPGGSHLTKAQDRKVLEIARTIRSEIPLYVAVVNNSNVDLKGCFIVSCIVFQIIVIMLSPVTTF